MSHQLSHESGRPEMAYSGTKPWHQLGTQVPGLMTLDEALTASNLNWSVSKVPVLSAHDLSPVPGKYTVIRSDTYTPLGIVGTRYTPISNREAFATFDTALGQGQGQIDTIGALGHGERVWCLAKLPDTFEAAPGDPVDRYLLCCTSHDGSSSIEVMFTTIRVVCNNTLTAAINGTKLKVAIRHTRGWNDRLDQAHLVLNQSLRYWQEMTQACQWLARQSVSRVEVGAFMDHVFPKAESENQAPKGRVEVQRLLEEGLGSDIPAIRGTKWALFNAYTEFLDHHKETRSGKHRWAQSTFGSGDNLRSKAMRHLVSQ